MLAFSIARRPQACPTDAGCCAASLAGDGQLNDFCETALAAGLMVSSTPVGTPRAGLGKGACGPLTLEDPTITFLLP